MIKPSQLLWVNGLLALALAGASYGRQTEHRPPRAGKFLAAAVAPFRGWEHKDIPLSKTELDILQPDDALVRRFFKADQGMVELAVIAGHKKRTVHTPAFCMAGGGWETYSQRDFVLTVGGRQIPVVQTVLVKENRHQVMTYFFTDGELVTRSLPDYQWDQFYKRLKGQGTLGALVRVIVPFEGDRQGAAERMTETFAAEQLPGVLQRLKEVRLAS